MTSKAPGQEASTRIKAIVQDRYGTPQQVLTMEEVAMPPVGDDDVLVEMRATSINTPDWITVTGVPYLIRLQSGLRRPPSPVRGTDVAGVVASVGRNVAHFRPGDEVFGSWWSGGLRTQGTFAEYSAGPAWNLIEKPATISFEEAAAAGMSALTAIGAIRNTGVVGDGTTVLINGASGGVGTFAVQVAKLLGAEVTGVCSTKNIGLVESLGADHVVDYTQEDFTRSKKKYDVILDNVMNHPPARAMRALGPGGTYMPNSAGTKGGLFGGLPRMARAALAKFGRNDVRFVSDWAPDQPNLRVLAAWLSSGEIKSVIDRVYPLAEAGEAVAHMLGHHARGNILLSI